MSDTIKNISAKFPNEQGKIFTNVIKQIMSTNNGILSTKMIEPLNISRQYISIMGRIMKLKRYQEGYTFHQLPLKIAIFSFNKNIKKPFFHI